MQLPILKMDQQTMSKLKMGMIGGGEGSFIGPVHRMAAELDGEIELVCGAFSGDATRSVRSGQRLYGLSENRCYPDFMTMLRQEGELPVSERMDFVTITTPNHLHFEAAECALNSGFHVVCDKPLTHRLTEALALQRTVAQSGKLLALTHNYTGYPMIREARSMVSAGELGKLRRIDCDYLQGWLATDEENTGNKQAQWRTDPARAGIAGCIGDIGSHAHNLMEYVSGVNVSAVCADLSTFVSGRRLDDDANVLLRFENGAKGMLRTSQIAVGEENNLTLRLYGELAALEWSQQNPNTLIVRWPDRSIEQRRNGGPGLSVESAAASRFPAGHPEGYLEAFATLYREFAVAVRQQSTGSEVEQNFPGITAGVRGMQFIERVVESSASGGSWLPLQ